MSIADKLTTIAENQQKVYDAGFAAAQEQGGDYDDGFADGKQAEYDRLVDPTKIIEKTVSGSVIRVDDVSEIPHKCTVSVDNDASVTVCGKNFIYPDVVAFPSNYWRRDGEAFVSDENTSATYVYVELYLEAFKTYTFSAYIKPNAAGTYSLTARYNGATVISNYPKEEGRYSISVTPTQNGVYRFTVGGVNNDSGMIVSQLQLEVGSTATAYELYRGTTYAISAGQTIEVDSICPTMTLFADNDTTITFGYHKSYGAQTEYDRFWDAFQQNGERAYYDAAFQYSYWTDDIYNPKYPIKLEESNGGRQAFNSNQVLTDIKVPIYAKNTRLSHTFNLCYKLKTIPLLRVENVTEYTNAFNQCKELENITVDGEISANISFEHSIKLTKESILSIVNALSDTAEGKTLTLSLTAVDIAFFDYDTEFNGSDSDEWIELRDSKPNWTITLV